MRNISKNGFIIVGFFAFFLLIAPISAETATDETGDVWIYKFGTTGMVYNEYSGTKEDIDITSVSYELSESTVTATLTVAGQIINDPYHTYIIYLENPSGQYYATYSAGSGLWIGTDKYGGELGQLSEPISGNTFTAIFEINHPEDSFDLYGFASESVDATEAYHDYAPDIFAPYYEGSKGDDEPVDETDSNELNTSGDIDESTKETDEIDSKSISDKGTPGFEIFAFLYAFIIMLLFVKKRK